MTLLSMCQQAARLMGLEDISSVTSTNNRTSRRLWAAANRSGMAILRRAYWQELVDFHTFTAINQVMQDQFSLPDDFDRYIPETAYNQTRQKQLGGPLTPAKYQNQRRTGFETTAYPSFRVRAGYVLITPAPIAGDTISFEYRSVWWVDTAINGTVDGFVDASEFTNDLDETLFDEEMMVLDIVWRYEKSVGLPYAEDFRSAELMIADRIVANAAGKAILDLSGGGELRSPIPPIIPPDNWLVP